MTATAETGSPTPAAVSTATTDVQMEAPATLLPPCLSASLTVDRPVRTRWALRRAFTLENLQWLCSSWRRRKTQVDRRLARFLSVCSLDWRGALRAWELNHAWARTLLPSICSPADGDDALTLRDVSTAA